MRNTKYSCLPYWGGQTLSAILSEPYGIRLLDENCQVAIGPGYEGLVMKHYVGAVRNLAYREGIPRVTQILNDWQLRVATTAAE